MSDVARRYSEIRRRLEAAARRVGRDPTAVHLVGASKMQPLEALRAAYDAGLRRFGENRVQEAQRKAPELPADVEWHLLGPLQSNKARPAVALFDRIHAVDRAKIAHALDAEAASAGRVVRGLVEVNLGGESTKHGFDPATLADEIAPLAALANLRLEGLMAIPPPGPTPEDSRPYFRRLRELRDALDARPEWNGRLRELSMGMSDDFEVAIEEGATFVRVGTRLFGARG